jgi:hypothetical protein
MEMFDEILTRDNIFLVINIILSLITVGFVISVHNNQNVMMDLHYERPWERQLSKAEKATRWVMLWIPLLYFATLFSLGVNRAYFMVPWVNATLMLVLPFGFAGYIFMRLLSLAEARFGLEMSMHEIEHLKRMASPFRMTPEMKEKQVALLLEDLKKKDISRQEKYAIQNSLKFLGFSNYPR